MKHEPVEWRPLTLRPALDAPADMPPGEITVAVPVHPRARPVELDTRQVFGFSPSFYVKVADPVSYEVALGMDSLREWFEASLADASYRCDPIIGHSGDGRTGESVEWTVLYVRPSTTPDVAIQVTLRPRDAWRTIATYRAELYPVPPRDPASFLPISMQRVDVEYTFLNGPERNIRCVIHELAPPGTGAGGLPGDQDRFRLLEQERFR